MFGLCFTYICGLIIIIVSLSLNAVLCSLSKRFHLSPYSYVEWASTETLQLQRMAFQSVKSGKWSGSVSSIPITSQAGEVMANLLSEYPLDEVRCEKPTSDAVIEVTAADTSVSMSPLKTSIAPSQSTEITRNSSRVGTVSTMDMEVSPITPTITAAAATSLKP